MSQVIARRYRPQTFAEVIGQEPIVRTLRNAIESGRVGHGFIFSGHRGIGKTTVARILAKAMNCQQGGAATATPCGECASCREIRDGNAVDVIEIDAASNRGIEEIRALRERVRYRPSRDRYKFFILDEAHQLTDDAFNALLKTLEEPPEWAMFVLATTEPEALPATIRSRCQHFGFRAVSFAVILEHLRGICGKEGIAADEEALGLIAEGGEGSVRDALSLLDQAIAHGGGQLEAEAVRGLLGRVASGRIGELLQAVAAGEAGTVLRQAGALLAAGIGPAPLCRQLTQTVRNTLVAASAGADSELLELTESERTTAAAAAVWFNEEELTRFLQILLRTAGELRHGQQERLHLELGLMKMSHARRLSSVEEVLARLGGGETPAPRPSAPATPTLPAPPAPPPRRATGIPEVPPPPRPAATPTPAPVSTPIAESSDPATAIRAALEKESGTLASLLQGARIEIEGNKVRLLFSTGAAGKAVLAGQAATKKQIAQACQAVMKRTVEVSIEKDDAAAEPHATEPVASPGSVEERAERHPLLQKLRATLPHHVLGTREFKQE